MVTKEQFTAQVERVNDEFARWFNNQPTLLAMYNTMTETQKREFRGKMIGLFAIEIMKNFQ